MIIINEPPTISCHLYDKNNNLIGEITSEWQLNDCRIQIKNESSIKGLRELSGYYIKFKDNIIHIFTDGSIDNWVTGFFDQQEEQFKQLYLL